MWNIRASFEGALEAETARARRVATLAAGALALLVAGTGCPDDEQGTAGAPAGGGGGADVSFGDGGPVPDGGAPAGDTGAEGSDDADSDGEAGGPGGCRDCAAPAVCLDGFCVAAQPCTSGDVQTCLDDSTLLVCHDSGGGYVPVDCPANQACFLPGECVPVICLPGTAVCEGLTSTKACTPDGTGFEEPIPCPDGQYCTGGECTSTCETDPKFGSYLGCAFWTVDLPNYPDPTLSPTPEDSPHAVVISNPNELPAEITWEPPPGVALDWATSTVPGLSSAVFEFPLINTSGSGITQAAIRFESSRPVLVHQFNPWSNEYSNDASLLLPETLAGSDYVVVTTATAPLDALQLIPSLPPPPSQHGYFTVVAIEDDTAVTIQASAWVLEADDGSVPSMPPGAIETFTLQAGDVLNLQSNPPKPEAPLSPLEDLFEFLEYLGQPRDLTGSTISANKPVMAFGGHEETVIGDEDNAQFPGEETDGNCCADHLEEQLLPVQLLESSYLAVKAKPRGGEPDHWRVVAAEPNVAITTTPPIAGLHGQTLQKVGDWLEVKTDQSFEIVSTGKLLVAQLLVSQQVTDEVTGDPSMMLAVPIQRFRATYVLMVPPEFSTNWVTITKKASSSVSVDGTPVPQGSFAAFGSGAYEFAYVELAPGIHQFDSSDGERFGLMAYGYGPAVSYGYPGGFAGPGE